MNIISKIRLLVRIYKSINYYNGFMNVGRIEFDENGEVKSITTKFYDFKK